MSQSLTGSGLAAPPEDRPIRRRLSSLKWEAKLFALVLLLHGGVGGGLVTLDWIARPIALVEEEIPVEVVAEPPPPPAAQQPQPQAEPQKPPDPQSQQQRSKSSR